jgi:4-hydroxybenzoate polyprenyltransferase
MSQLIILLRPWQWVKNLLIFIPLILSSKNFNDAFSGLLPSFVIFSLFVSSTYIFNDIKDIDTDKLHQTKKNRPIAAGRIEIKSAKLISIIIFTSTFIISYFIDNRITPLFLSYALVTYFYTNFFKYVYLLDTFSISLMYVIRVLIGSTVANVNLTIYLGAFIFFTSCLLSISKKISIINSPDITSNNSFYELLNHQDSGTKFKRLYILFGITSSGLLLLWLINLYNEFLKLNDIIFLTITNLAFIIFTIFIYKYSLRGDLEDFSKELFKNKILFFVSLVIIISFSIGYF